MGRIRYISNVEIADCMLRVGVPVTVKEILELLAKYHPTMKVDVPFVRTRLAMFERSPNVICVVNKETRPATYHMLSINQEFFRGARNGKALRFAHTVIPKKSRDSDNTTISAWLRQVWYELELKRFYLTRAHHA